MAKFDNSENFRLYGMFLVVISKYLHLPSIFPKCVGDQSAFMRAWLHRYVNQHSATYIVLLSAYDVVMSMASTPFSMSISKVNDM